MNIFLYIKQLFKIIPTIQSTNRDTLALFVKEAKKSLSIFKLIGEWKYPYRLLFATRFKWKFKFHSFKQLFHSNGI